MRKALVLTCAALISTSLGLGACATTSPKKTVASLDRSDARYKSSRCVAARKEAAAFDEHKDGRAVIALAGNLIVPFAGSAASFAMDRMKDDDRKALDRKVKAACISDPLGKRRVATR